MKMMKKLVKTTKISALLGLLVFLFGQRVIAKNPAPQEPTTMQARLAALQAKGLNTTTTRLTHSASMSAAAAAAAAAPVATPTHIRSQSAPATIKTDVVDIPTDPAIQAMTDRLYTEMITPMTTEYCQNCAQHPNFVFQFCRHCGQHAVRSRQKAVSSKPKEPVTVAELPTQPQLMHSASMPTKTLADYLQQQPLRRAISMPTTDKEFEAAFDAMIDRMVAEATTPYTELHGFFIKYNYPSSLPENGIPTTIEIVRKEKDKEFILHTKNPDGSSNLVNEFISQKDSSGWPHFYTKDQKNEYCIIEIIETQIVIAKTVKDTPCDKKQRKVLLEAWRQHSPYDSSVKFSKEIDGLFRQFNRFNGLFESSPNDPEYRKKFHVVFGKLKKSLAPALHGKIQAARKYRNIKVQQSKIIGYTAQFIKLAQFEAKVLPLLSLDTNHDGSLKVCYEID